MRHPATSSKKWMKTDAKKQKSKFSGFSDRFFANCSSTARGLEPRTAHASKIQYWKKYEKTFETRWAIKIRWAVAELRVTFGLSEINFPTNSGEISVLIFFVHGAGWKEDFLLCLFVTNVDRQKVRRRPWRHRNQADRMIVDSASCAVAGDEI